MDGLGGTWTMTNRCCFSLFRLNNISMPPPHIMVSIQELGGNCGEGWKMERKEMLPYYYAHIPLDPFAVPNRTIHLLFGREMPLNTSLQKGSNFLTFFLSSLFLYSYNNQKSKYPSLSPFLHTWVGWEDIKRAKMRKHETPQHIIPQNAPPQQTRLPSTWVSLYPSSWCWWQWQGVGEAGSCWVEAVARRWIRRGSGWIIHTVRLSG